uniref:Uncharacterized protein n=2 Tax=Rhodosorus marinus TaxID=101924 RepID=A0A7S2ZE92_9RHOD|eukprot:CAMPEP_0113968464 /NCGR_PEP_ID=MMETSP0011_2-20120614/9554_1 /TAXON_ID=101924 /ORGANISM="Rhodosorus marinus" /LENGTH=557 /DNA_ID=CAMNT_0000981569 /DNA_START=33 /DNA_END=1706 /DNA_ORIENTATION=- /assembly_acc=CAM_ASM_000156
MNISENQKELVARSEELDRLEEELVRRSESLDAFAEHVDERLKQVEAKSSSLKEHWNSVEASRMLAEAIEKRVEEREAGVRKERKQFLREMSEKQKKLAELELQRIAALEEADRRLAESSKASAAMTSENERLAHLRSQSGQAEKRINSMLAREKALKSSADELHEEIQRATDLLSSLTSEISTSREELDKLESHKIDVEKLKGREDRVLEIEDDYRVLSARFGEDAKPFGSLGAWLHARGGQLAESISQVTRREEAVRRREMAVEVNEAREIRVVEAERTVRLKEQRVKNELSELEILRSDLNQQRGEVENELKATIASRREAAIAKRELEARAIELEHIEEGLTEKEKLMSEKEASYEAKVVALDVRQKEVESREKSLLDRENDILKHEDGRRKLDFQFEAPSAMEEADLGPSPTDELLERVERLNALALSLGAEMGVVNRARALAEEVATTRDPPKEVFPAWEARLVELLKEVSKSQREIDGSTSSPNDRSSDRGSNVSEFMEFRRALGQGQDMGDIISAISGSGRRRAPRASPDYSVPKPLPTSERRSAPPVL